jgi:RNA-directed DNA polymerase
MPQANNAEDKVRRLQVKLYQAAKQSPARRFHALYDKIYRDDILHRAWEHVRANRGAAGVDGITIAQVEAAGVNVLLNELAEELKAERYHPLPSRRVWLPKPQGDRRPLGVPALRDRIVETAAKLVLEPLFEADFLDCSYGYRPKRSARQALDRLREEVQRGRRWVVDTDIRNFFEVLDHQRLMECLRERLSDRRMLKLLRGWLKAGVLDGQTLLHPDVGTPQGAIVSPLLANVYLTRLDRAWEMEHKAKGVLLRFADDLVIMCWTRADAEAALQTLRQILAAIGLGVAEAKTRIVQLKQEAPGIDFLGFHHRIVRSFRNPRRYFLARWPSQKAMRTARARIRDLTDRRWLLRPVPDVVAAVNRFLRGWAAYFSRGNSTRHFHTIDEYVVERLSLFLSKKHGQSGKRYGGYLLGRSSKDMGLCRLVGTVGRGQVAHAV